MSNLGSFNVGGLPDPHQHSMNHRAQIEASAVCGCFRCGKTFSPAVIEDWVDDGQTALCPKCGIDSVIGDASGIPVADPGFLKKMKRRWF